MDHTDIQTILTLFEHSRLTKLKITSPEYTIEMEGVVSQLTSPSKDQQSSSLPCEEKKPNSNITSPIVGTFYRTPAPDAPPYVEVGDQVKKGSILCTLEAMKLMNQLEAEYDCEIISVLADQGSMVEFGQPLFEVRRL